MAGGSDETGFFEGVEIDEGAVKLADIRAGRDQARSEGDVEVEGGEDLFGPVAVEVEKLAVRGVGAFGDGGSAEAVQDVLGEI